MNRLLTGITLGFLSIFFFYYPVLALDQNTAISTYSAELVRLGMDPAMADQKAQQDVGGVLAAMQASQSAVSTGFAALSDRVDKLQTSDTRKDAAEDALDKAESSKDAFVDMDPASNLFVQESIGGTPPLVMAGDDFKLAQQTAEQDQGVINRILIAPNRPGAVPAGDIVSDFIPGIIRQLFRFASVVILISFTVSGVFLVTAHGEDDKVTKARSMLYYTIIGFAFVALAFAIVKAVTDIDFFRFI